MTPQIPDNEAPHPIAALGIGDVQPIADDTAPDQRLPFPTVVVGASAGGVEALMRLFTVMPPHTGCAFVVALHMSPDRESLLAPLIARGSRIKVVPAEDGQQLAANHVFVLPPGLTYEVSQGRFVTSELAPRAGKPVAIDLIMRSLAADQRERVIGIVLTGSDGDGSLGVKAIRAEGGLTIAQRPDSAAHRGMPDSAIATGDVDQQLTIEEMPAAIAAYVATLTLPPPGADEASSAIFEDILDIVRSVDGLDFREYKPPMLVRRVRRRMALARVTDFEAYRRYLAETPAESSALAEDFLIGVTEFFREPEAWEALAREALPAILHDKRPGEAVRAWVPACSTGEEAYSLAMLLLEQPKVAEQHLKLQVFATDINPRALEAARRGVYRTTIEKTVSPERLRRFFTQSKDGYVVRKELRECVIFAPQNLQADPPFSRMDLVSCRNLLIYLQHRLQLRVLQVVHFALDTGGYLFLGKSETIDGQTALFAPVSKVARIYRRMGESRHPTGPRLPVPVWRARTPPSPAMQRKREVDYGRAIRDALLDRRVAAAVLIDDDGRMLYFYGPVKQYLDMPEGTPSNDLFALAREDLRPQLRAAVHKVVHEGGRVETIAGVRRESGTDEAAEDHVRMVVSRAESQIGAEGFLLVTFEMMQPAEGAPRPLSDAESSQLQALETELRNTKRELRTTIEELESANEELKVGNEEAMSMNEELQSTNEELETSKEELQSVNEELTTVNTQLQEKVLQLEEVNDVLSNLLSSTHIATLFLDRNLRIRRYTPAATSLFSLIPGDVNRPLTDIAGQVDMHSLMTDATDVLERLTPVQREERTAGGRHFLRRVLPYRTFEDRIDGIVVTFTDITELRRGEEDTRRLAAVMRACHDAIIVHDGDGRIMSWSGGAEELYGYTAAEAVGRNMALVIPPEMQADYRMRLGTVMAGRPAEMEARRRRKDGSDIDVAASLSLIPSGDGRPASIATIEHDITPRKIVENRLRESEQRFRMMADSAPVLVWISDAQGRIEFANNEFTSFVGTPLMDLQGRRWVDLLEHADITTPLKLSTESVAGRAGRIEITAKLTSAGGEARWMKVTALPRPHGPPEGAGLIGSMVDIHAQVEATQAMRTSNLRKDEFLAMLGHELRNPLVPVRNAAEVLRRVGLEDERLAWAHDTLVRQVGHITRLVDDLLDISRVTRGSLMLHVEPVDIGHAMRSAIEATAPLLERKRHRLEVTLPASPVFVEGDAIRLVQVFENLLINAAKYTDEGGQISVTMVEQGRDVVATVRDNGVGISAAMAERIFDLFVQDARSVDRSQGGLGIGLSLVRHLVQLHNGTIEARSEGEGRGSEFVVRMPRLSPAISVAPAHEHAHAQGQGRVLIVDDDVEGGESMAMVVRMMGYEVRFASDLASALRHARELRPRVVLVDIAMPDADGYEVAARLRALPEMANAAGYVALSGFGHPRDRKASEHAGMAYHLVKPVEPDELERVLRELLGR